MGRIAMIALCGWASLGCAMTNVPPVRGHLTTITVPVMVGSRQDGQPAREAAGDIDAYVTNSWHVSISGRSNVWERQGSNVLDVQVLQAMYKCQECNVTLDHISVDAHFGLPPSESSEIQCGIHGKLERPYLAPGGNR